jgi:hypothetical protein
MVALQTPQCAPSVRPVAVQVGATAESDTSVCGTTGMLLVSVSAQLQERSSCPSSVQLADFTVCHSLHVCSCGALGGRVVEESVVESGDIALHEAKQSKHNSAQRQSAAILKNDFISFSFLKNILFFNHKDVA